MELALDRRYKSYIKCSRGVFLVLVSANLIGLSFMFAIQSSVSISSGSLFKSWPLPLALVDVHHQRNESESSSGKFLPTKSQPRTQQLQLQGNTTCNATRLMPDGTFPHIALASFPGSGNTWVRYLIERATGYATGSIYRSKILRANGFIGECVPEFSGRALTIKTHEYIKGMNHALLLVRNPYSALVAKFNRKRAGKTDFADNRFFKLPGWEGFVRKHIQKWYNLTSEFVRDCQHPEDSNATCKSVQIIYYENLQEDLELELRRLLSYLPVEFDPQRFACTLREAEGMFHRPKRNATISPFSREQRSTIEEHIAAFYQLVEEAKLEYPPKALELYPF